MLLSYFPFVHKNLKLIFIVTIFRLTNNFNTLPGMVFVLFLFDLLNTAAENAALASKSQTKIGVRPCTD